MLAGNTKLYHFVNINNTVVVPYLVLVQAQLMDVCTNSVNRYANTVCLFSDRGQGQLATIRVLSALRIEY